MGVEARKKAVLRLLYETGIALPQKTIYLNLRRHYTYHWGKSTVKTALDELVEEKRVEALDRRYTYYEITDTGREYFKEVS